MTARARQASIRRAESEDDSYHSSVLTGDSTPERSNDNEQSHSTSVEQRPSRNLTWDDEMLKRDTLILSMYVKEEMYYGVKFLYDPKEDLAIGGVIYNHFCKHCSNKLEGVKSYQTQREKEIYIKFLWKNATEERVQQDSLAVKRSSVYTVMQNRFFCK